MKNNWVTLALCGFLAFILCAITYIRAQKQEASSEARKWLASDKKSLCCFKTKTCCSSLKIIVLARRACIATKNYQRSSSSCLFCSACCRARIELLY
jgi:hypothetical protein